MDGAIEFIHTSIWEEIPHEDNPFVAEQCFCAGYDVYGDLLGKANWIEYLYLLFKQERPSKQQSQLLEGLAIAIANPGPRDYSVRAAMSAGVGDSTHASRLMAALAVGAGQLGGAREVYLAMELWKTYGCDLDAWQTALSSYKRPDMDDLESVWPVVTHPPGFDPYGESCPLPVRQTLQYLCGYTKQGHLAWLAAQRLTLEARVNMPLAMTGVMAAALMDLAFTSEQGEMLVLLLRLPGAAVHGLEQARYGWRHYPFFSKGLILEDDVEESDRDLTK